MIATSGIHIAIVGGGLSGTLAALRLLQSAKEGTTIYLLEKEEEKLYRGVAYSSKLPFQPLNVPASCMSLFPEKPVDFADWLIKNQPHYNLNLPEQHIADAFIPRFIFGDYVAQRLKEAEADALAGVQLRQVKSTVLFIEPNPFTGVCSVRLKDGSLIKAHKVVLAPGNLPPLNVPIRNMAFYSSDRYKASPWAADALEALPTDAPVLLIGSSLTMVDLVGSLHARGHSGRIYVVSRHGMLPKAYNLGAKPLKLAPLPTIVFDTVTNALRYVRETVAEAAADGYTWHSVIDALRTAIPVIWQRWPIEEKKRFLRHVRPFWEVHRHRMPDSSALLLQQLQEQGQLVVLAGTLETITLSADTAKVVIRKRGQQRNEIIAVARVINCTGPLCDYIKSTDPLLRQLLNQGLIKPDMLRLGLETTAEGNLVGADNNPNYNLFTLGPPRKGMLYESTALHEIRQQAVALAEAILEEVEERKKEV
ncbi:hypothetical protein FVR03_06635 [Pontibacter qinzhouensis]|uniref:FAD-dependent urate hydroxylase HpyO/Asp monooxygenase CreE-like FAD/NAD(P)-binding domain-containing protein n=1 Tax=Pontibacter qinzhouensis TaxID=2603253 RepID=A0A5C8KCE9_9BACT|nr:FAD/NAD(P)-binding protein [Pontibacter qinzhouensis]TXK49239.1 hypothetical protein FVR03_06635 [Pontibacter qinzhouensis]